MSVGVSGRRRLVGVAALLAGVLVASLVLPALNASAAPTRYEAENAAISQGVVEANHLNFSGTGFVNYDNLVGSYVQWTVTAASAGTATVAFRHANGTTANRPMDVTVNGALVADELAFNPTGTWDAWATVTITVAVNAGGYVQWTVNAAAAGTVTFEIRYANGSTANRPMDITVNGALVADELAFNPTANWDTWADQTFSTALTAGTNTVRATATTANGGPNV